MDHRECAHPPTKAARNGCRLEGGEQSSGREGKYGLFADAEIHELSAEEIWELRRGDVQDLRQSLKSYAKYHGLTLSMVKTPDKGLRFRMWGEQEVVDDGLADFLPPELVEREENERRGADLWLTPRPRPSTPRAHKECDHPKTPWDRAKCRGERDFG
ncbi:hypothetical protein [Streptomyces sp. t99]|uniref:hypothetical protein n=1 Tax=Streptomyces sp. t99 TaxID=1828172 RepID=UPI000BFE6ACF|nr:hypothetical protein [Streptomyces sp. t99]